MTLFTAGDAVRWFADTGIGPRRAVDVAQIDVGRAGRPLPKMPHRLAAVYPVDGPGESHEGVVDVRGYQLRLRWSPNDPEGAERAALQADHLIRRRGASSHWAGAPGGAWLLYVTRSGGAPSPLGDERADGDRTTYVTTYLFALAEHAHEEMM